MADVPIQDTRTMTKTIVHLMQGDVPGLVEDAIDLGFAISDLVRKRGSSASKILREKADYLETALNQTVDSYNIAMPD